MRKRCLLLLLVAGLLCGCHPASESGGTTDYAGDLSKAQEIAVIPASAAAPTQVLTLPQDRSDFVLALDLAHWTPESLPDTAVLLGTFRFSQERTLLWGEQETDGTLYPLCEIRCYEDLPYLTLAGSGFVMTYRVPETASSALAAYFSSPT